MINKDQVFSLARDFLKIVGTYLTTSGVTTSSQWELVVGGILAAAGIVWSQYDKKTKPEVPVSPSTSKDV